MSGSKKLTNFWKYLNILLIFNHLLVSVVDGFQSTSRTNICRRRGSVYKMAVETSAKTPAGGYEPKWKKKKTLAEEAGTGVGLVGNIPVVFRQGNETRRTLALAGSPLSFAAAQAGQPIRYGCKKGECGTCEALCNGKWIRPCVAVIPELPAGEEFVLVVKEIKKAKSSGKFFSVRSFIMGFYNNLLGMVGFVKQRKAAKKNFQERLELEEMIRKKALEKKKARASEGL